MPFAGWEPPIRGPLARSAAFHSERIPGNFNGSISRRRGMSPQILRFKQTLRFKLGFYLSVALWTAMLVFITLVTLYLRQQLFNGAADHVTQLSEVITKSTRYAMLQNQPTYVDRIIHDVASQDSIDKVRIFSKDGRIINSTYAEEIGKTLDRKAEDCYLCHADDRTPSRDEQAHLDLRGAQRRAAARLDGAHPQRAVLLHRRLPPSREGHADPRRPRHRLLARRDRRAPRAARRCGSPASRSPSSSSRRSRSGCSCTAWSTGRCATSRTAPAGSPPATSTQPIPVRSDDEFGQLARSFNDMTTALRDSRAELRDWGRTLEQRVERRTEQLRRAAGRGRARREARLGRPARLRHRPRAQQSAHRHPHLLVAAAAEAPRRQPGRRGHRPGHPRDQALRRHHQAPARLRARQAAGEEVRRPQPGHRGHGAHRRAAGAGCATSRSRSTSTAPCRRSGSTPTRSSRSS